MRVATENKGVADWLFPSVSDLIFLCLFFWALRYGVQFLADGDTGWHITTGRYILKSLGVPHADPYSYTMPATPWTSHEWLAEILFAGIHSLAGLNGVVVLSSAIVSLTFFLLYRYVIRRGAGPFAAVFFTVTGALASMLHWLSRPHLFSMPLTLATFIVLEDYQRDGRDRLWLLPLFTLVWVNLHGGYILGIMMVFIYSGSNLVKWLASGRADGESGKKAKALTIISFHLFAHA
jgi:hypothetical protein